MVERPLHSYAYDFRSREPTPFLRAPPPSLEIGFYYVFTRRSSDRFVVILQKKNPCRKYPIGALAPVKATATCFAHISPPGEGGRGGVKLVYSLEEVALHLSLICVMVIHVRIR